METNLYVEKEYQDILKQLKQGRHLIFLVRQGQCGGYFLERLDCKKSSLCPNFHSIEETFIFKSFFAEDILFCLNDSSILKGHSFIDEQGFLQIKILKKIGNEWNDFSVEQVNYTDDDTKVYTIKKK